jgi:transposase-like protein
MNPDLPDLSDEMSCYRILVEALHPDGLRCPRCGSSGGLGVHRRHREPVLDYQCRLCHRVFNAWTGTPLEKTHRRPSEIQRILWAIARGTPTAQLARELQCQRAQLLALRRRLVPLAQALFSGPQAPTNEQPDGQSLPGDPPQPE